MKFLICLGVFINLAFSLTFSVKENGKSLDDNNTVLILGGIQGDEPGGFHAASLLLSDYNITKGKIIVVPNLAFESIIARNRGNFGDLNRKFANLDKNDPDYHTIERIKELILTPEINMVINLHDGSGFYRPKYENKDKNPNRWGNTSIIDQSEVNSTKYADLENIAKEAVENINKALVTQEHQYHLKNTKTQEKNDKDMLKALTYFVVSNHKAAFANEASKNLPTHLRVYYHLLAIEYYLKKANIEFTRTFELTPNGVYKAIEKPLEVRLFNDKILIYLDRPNPTIKFLPFPVNQALNYEASNEITAVISGKNSYSINYGNRLQTRIYPEYFEFSNALDSVELIVDGQNIQTSFAKKIMVKQNFKIPAISGVRVNVIGFDRGKDESEILISKNQMQSRYSLDKKRKIYRVEFYELKNANLNEQILVKNTHTKEIKNVDISNNLIEKAEQKDKFLGMILVEFE
ncbi:deacylase [Campylobacter volucris]|uniref:M99 family carboxypeptidase catalytic domain-containing protein n=1 Tax=Campylobacter volucris TaxID=1031542 RepID=UPI00189FDDE4|nr:M99 family carboxypeptidase catalytic domain-containing protein [Campylobacter volucris]MBF7049169.1 deacylase [Campylobacter volucris]MBF7060395.1 deacylase [Campylobacter volucris]